VYRLTRIAAARDGAKLYSVDRRWKTRKVLDLTLGGRTKEFAISNVSNDLVSESEFAYWRGQLLVRACVVVVVVFVYGLNLSLSLSLSLSLFSAYSAMIQTCQFRMPTSSKR
jgi:hypothetical protein